MLLYIVWNVLTPVFLVVAAGVVGQRWLRMDVRTLSTAAFYVFTPCLVFTALSHTQLDLLAVSHIVTLDLGMTVTLTAFGWVYACRWGRDSALRNACILTIVIPNAGNYGIPVSRFAFGEKGMIFQRSDRSFAHHRKTILPPSRGSQVRRARVVCRFVATVVGSGQRQPGEARGCPALARVHRCCTRPRGHA